MARVYAVPAEIQSLSQRHQSLWLLSSPQAGAHSTMSKAHAPPVLLRTVAQAPALAHTQDDRGCNAHGISACCLSLCSTVQGPTLMVQTPAPHSCSAAASVALRSKMCHQCLLFTGSQGPPTSPKNTPGPRPAGSATGITAFPGPDTHMLGSASTFGPM